MQNLQLPAYSFRVEERGGKGFIFDEFRRRWVNLTPEEWVRQHFLKFLVEVKGFPASLMAVEKMVMINGLRQRFDLLVWDRRGNPLLVAEFKAATVEITQSVFDQAVRYNSSLKAPFVLVSNGLSHFVCQIDFTSRQVAYLKEIPDYSSMTPFDF